MSTSSDRPLEPARTDLGEAEKLTDPDPASEHEIRPDHPGPGIPEEPNHATTDVDTTPGSPRPGAVEPNYATTDVEPDPPRH